MLGLGLVACGGEEPAPPDASRALDPAQAGTAAVFVSATEYGFDADERELHSGLMEFVATNNGQEKHKLTVVAVDDGRYGSPIAETDLFGPGDKRGLRVGLRPGTYELVCLVVVTEDAVARTYASHMARGMRMPFEVTP
jgi:hypothetical protein